MIVLLMGVSGAGKTTVGIKLAESLGYEFADADDFHPPANVEKMRLGIPLDDGDREPWLETLRGLMVEKLGEGDGLVLACSALKQRYRDILQIDDDVRFVHLKGGYELIEKRLAKRIGHFMNPQLLRSQFEALEEPEDALVVEVNDEPGMIVEKILEKLS